MTRTLLWLACTWVLAACVAPTGPATTTTGGARPAPDIELHVRPAFVVPPLATPPPSTRTARPPQPAVSGGAYVTVPIPGGVVRKEQIALLEGLIAETPAGDPERADLQFRLAELHARLMLAAVERAGAPAISDHERARETEAAAQSLARAVSAYGAVLESPHYPRRDLALRSLGHVLAVGGRRAEASAIHVRLVDEHPGSRYAVDALVLLGDDRFADGRIDEAAQFYQRAGGLADGARGLYLTYRRAWVALRLDVHADALAGLATVLTEARALSPPLATAARSEADALCDWRGEVAVATAAGTELASLLAARSPCVDLVLPRVGHAARARHVQALASGTPPDADAALALYDLYLAAAPDSGERAETLVVAAELAWHRAAIETGRTTAPPLWTAAAARFDGAGLRRHRRPGRRIGGHKSPAKAGAHRIACDRIDP